MHRNSLFIVVSLLFSLYSFTLVNAKKFSPLERRDYSAKNQVLRNLVQPSLDANENVDDSYIILFDNDNQNDILNHFNNLAFNYINLNPDIQVQNDINQVKELSMKFAKSQMKKRNSINDINYQDENIKQKSLGSIMGNVLKTITFNFNTNGQKQKHININIESSEQDDELSIDEVNVFGDLKINHHYIISDLLGYSAELPKYLIDAIKDDKLIKLIEQNKRLSIFGLQENSPSWGLNRVSSRKRSSPKNVGNYEYPDSAGSDVDAYIIDTGIFIDHPDFEGRARLGKSFTRDGSKNDDNGHGTHVAGTIGSKTYGVAKKVSLIAVKVLDGSGSGSTADVIAGIQFVAVEAPKSGRKSVANMSLGGGKSTAMDLAVKAAVEAGVTMVVAAGNSNGDACRLSPGSSPHALTVAASDISDRLAFFSEHGKCVDIIAPGVDITSTWNDGKINTISGTSMASPHVAGVVALALAEFDFTSPEEVKKYLQTISSKDRITGSLYGTINDLVYNHVEEGKIPDDEPKEPKEPEESDPEPPSENVCPFPQCLIDPACTDCDFSLFEKGTLEEVSKRYEDIHIVIDHSNGDIEVSVSEY